ncbi:hypothetical protein LL364_003776 [Citrobacter freundii]|nr:hypothetical protein [Citrobacter freundii]
MIYAYITDGKITAVFTSPQVDTIEITLDNQLYAEYFSLLPADVQSGLPAPVNLAHEK